MTQVLLAEDECVTRECARLALQNHGYTVTAVGNGLQALEKLKQNQYDIVLMDLKMPGLDGQEVVQKIRTTKNPSQRTPVIAVTAMCQDEIDKLSHAGFNGIISKPYEHHDLINTIRNLSKATATA